MLRTLACVCLSVLAVTVGVIASGGVSCTTNQMRCENGTCISSVSACDCSLSCTEDDALLSAPRVRRETLPSSNSDVCVLPKYPEHGTYKVANVKNTYPGQTFKTVVLTVYCRRGYGLESTSNDTDEVGKPIFCVEGRWLQTIPKCVRFCKLEPDVSIHYMCHIPGAGFKACPTYVPQGTVVSPVCNNLYHPVEDLGYMTCQRGYWNRMPRCKPECGLVTSGGKQLSIGGELAKHGELPWHVGVYSKSVEPYEQICGGSIISSNLVLSAAHCFWKDATLPPASDYAVAAGKLYRSWDSDQDITVQQSDIKEIKIPVLFKAAKNNYQEDIAALILVTPFVFQTYVRPVCISFDASFDAYQLNPSKSGKVAGWGLTSENGEASPELRVVDMPYISTDVCSDILPAAFTEYITSDKFCAGHLNGTALCKGDSGGGLAFADRERGKHRYYLRGIVSTAPTSDDAKCNSATYTAFTKITKHEDFIKRSLAASLEKSCPWYMFQCADATCVDGGADCDGKHDCPDGSDEAADLCIPEIATVDEPACVIPESSDITYFASGVPGPHIPGRSFDGFILHARCPRMNYIVTAEGRMKWGDHKLSCVDGVWSDGLPECVEYCDVDHLDPTVRYKCRHPTTNVPMICNKYVAPGLTCRGANSYTHGMRPDPVVKCVDNSSAPVECNKDCGRVPSLGSEPSGQMPWHVSIYEKSENDYSYYCGGTLLSNNVVLSAADRFWDEKAGYIRMSEWSAAVGQLHRLWEDERNNHAQKATIAKIIVPDTYTGTSSGYKHDVAVLVLERPLVLGAHVRHVCLDWHSRRDETALREGATVQIAGWGPQDVSSPGLRRKVFNLTMVDRDTCDRELPKFQEDHICTSYTDDELQFLNSNIGSGLVISRNVSGTQRYYLRGILTAKCLKQNLCFLNTYATFTRLTQLKQFIKYYTAL